MSHVNEVCAVSLPDVTGRHRGRGNVKLAGVVGGALIIIGGLAATVALTLPGGASAASRDVTLASTAQVAPPTSTQTIMHGIDVNGVGGSNPVTNWADVKAAGISFAGVEAWEGETVSNPVFAAQVSGALAAGVKVMPYVFANPEGLSTDTSPFTGADQFDDAWNNAIQGAGYAYTQTGGQWLPVVLDLEQDPVTSNNHPECYTQTVAGMVAWIQSFVAEAEAKTSVPPIIYTNQKWWKDCTGNSTLFINDPLWFPDYSSTPPTQSVLPAGSWSGYSFWQNSGSGTVNGVTGLVDLDQQAGLSVKPGNLSTVAGTPVSLRIAASGPDVAAGLPAFLKVSGLAAGMTLPADGLITGWPYVPGAYKITVSATDGLGAAAAASFTWTITAAPDTGPTGLIQQHGGSDKCLDDPSSRTANGTAIDLSACVAKPYQEWTAVQDGTIRVLGHCLTASGTHILLYGCNNSIAEEWQAGTDGSLVSARYGTCLNGSTGAVANGTRPTLVTCTNSTATVAQHWNRPVAPIVFGLAARCLGAAGGVAELVTCANSTAQHWLVASSGEIAVQANGYCLTDMGAGSAGSSVTVAKCVNSALQHWTVVSAGVDAVQIRSALTASTASSCLTVTAGASASGTPLVIGTCSTFLNATWRIG